MPLFVHVTEDCYAQASRHGLANELDHFRDRVEKSQGTSLFDPFPPPFLVRKKFGGRQGRLIAVNRPVVEHTVVILAALLIRGDRTYTEFSDDPSAFQDRFDIPDDEELAHI